MFKLLSFISLALDILAITTSSIYALFDNPGNPTRLVQPSGGVPIDVAIDNADNNLSQLRLTGSYQVQVLNLAELLGLAKGLLILTPYFTDLNMTTLSATAQSGIDLSTTNSSINSLGITNPSYMQILYGLMGLLSNVAQSIVFLLNETSFNIAFFNLFKTLDLSNI
jgi:hypothetical protein